MTTMHTASPQRVVVGIDGSEQSKQALRWAAHFAGVSGARLDVIATWMLPTSYGLRWVAVPEEFGPEQQTSKALTETVDDVFGAHRPADIHLSVFEGHPAKVLIEQSKGALMLVVGSRGHGGFAGLLLGSVSTKVAEHATCPVVVVHADQAPPQA